MFPLSRRFRPVRRRFAVASEVRAARVWEDLVEELPDEDLGEEPDDALEFYRLGSKPRCEEAEYLAILRDAAGRIAGGR